MMCPAATAAVAAFAARRRPPPPNGGGAGLSRTMAHGARDGGESDEWDDWEADEGDFFGTFQSLFDGTTFDSLEALLAHDRAAHGFDLPHAAKRLDLDFFGVIRLVNLVRKEAGDGAGAKAVLEGLREGGPLAERLGDESLFVPVLPDDGVLCCAEQILSAAKDVEVADDALFEKREEPAADEQELQAQVERLQAQLARASALLGQLAVDEALGGEEEESGRGEGGQDNDTYYSNGYSAFGIHETMLRDAPRTLSYRRALTENPALMEGAAVLDVGCGTGVLSMFAARGGASKVVGVDFSETVRLAQQLVADNGLDGVVSIRRGKVEDMELDGKFDVLVSEWMGYCLFYENMLESVLDARDRYLKPGGTLFPDKCCMKLAAVADPSRPMAFWADVYGLDYRRVRPKVLEECEVEVVPDSLRCSHVHTLRRWDLRTMVIDDADFSVDFELAASGAAPSLVTGFVAWFDCDFDHGCDTKVTLATGPADPETHWKQALFHLDEDEYFTLSPGEVLGGSFSMARGDPNPREMDVTIQWQVPGGAAAGRRLRSYHMGV